MTMPKAEGGKKNFAPFLQADDLKEGEQSIEVLGVRKADENMEYSDYLLDVKVGKRTYVIGLKLDTSTYEILLKKFGPEEAKWKGTITVRPRYTKKYESGFVDVLD